jgi:hypothetical protein
MDPVTTLALISSIGALILSVLTHVKHSKCAFGECETRGKNSSPNEKTSLKSKGQSNLNFSEFDKTVPLPGFFDQGDKTIM